MIGYGWGAGLMLKPTALQSLSQAMKTAGQHVVARLPQPLQAALQQRQQQHVSAAGITAPLAGALGGGSSGGALSDPDLEHQQLLGGMQAGKFAVEPACAAALARLVCQHTCCGPAHLQFPLLPCHAGAGHANPESTGSGATSTTKIQQQRREQERQQEITELSRLVVKQQNQLGDLQQHVTQLQAAVCRIDATAPGCKAPR